MKSSKGLFRALCRALFFGLVLGLLVSTGGCKRWQMDEWIKDTSVLRKDAIREAEVVPYRKPQFEAIKSYFAEMVRKAAELKDRESFGSTLNWYLGSRDLEQVCEDLLISQAEWQLILKRCMRNRFFLCAEEVRAYSDSVKYVRGVLSAELQHKFDRTKACMHALDLTEAGGP